MQHFCNSWNVRNLLATVLRLNETPMLAESIVRLHPQQTAQAQHQLPSLSTVHTPHLECPPQWQKRPHYVAPSFHAERSSPQTGGHLNISNYAILNTVKMHARRTWQFAVRPDTLNLLRIMNSMLTQIQSEIGTWFPTSNTLKTSQTHSLNHCHLSCHRRKHTPPPVLCWGITLLNHGYAMLRVAFRQTNKRIPSIRLRRVKSTATSKSAKCNLVTGSLLGCLRGCGV